MANFPYIRAPGTWLSGSAVDPDEFEAINLYIFKSPNFADGGAYAPSVTPIEIGGLGLSMNAPLFIDGSGVITVSDGASFGMQSGSIGTIEADEFNFDGSCTVDFGGGQVTFSGSSDPLVQTGCSFRWQSGAVGYFASGSTFLTETGSTVSLAGATTWASTSDPQVASGCQWTWLTGSQATFATGADLICAAGSQVTLSGTTGIGGTVTLSGTTLLTGTITKSGNNGRILLRCADIAANTNATVDVSNDVWFYQQTNNTDHTITLRRTTSPTPSEGDTLFVHVKFDDAVVNGTSVDFINETTGDNICGVHKQGVLAAARAQFVYHSNEWRLLMLFGSDSTIDTTFGPAE